MLVPCTSFKAIATATQIRSKIELYLKKLGGEEIGPLGPRIEAAYSAGKIPEDMRNELEKILVECEKILFNMHEGDSIEFKEMISWASYVDSLPDPDQSDRMRSSFISAS